MKLRIKKSEKGAMGLLFRLIQKIFSDSEWRDARRGVSRTIPFSFLNNFIKRVLY